MTNNFEAVHRQQVLEAVYDIYGAANIEAAFITGSIAAGKARPDSDVDIVVCHSDTVDEPDRKKQAFTEFYFDFHEQLSREPDDISPGEVLAMSELQGAVKRIERVEPATTLYERDDFDAICWAGMVISRRDILIPYSETMTNIEKMSRIVVWNWAASLAPNQLLTEATGEYSDVDKVLRRTISSPGYYDAH